jgi:hypothetical protein
LSLIEPVARAWYAIVIMRSALIIGFHMNIVPASGPDVGVIVAMVIMKYAMIVG